MYLAFIAPAAKEKPEVTSHPGFCHETTSFSHTGWSCSSPVEPWHETFGLLQEKLSEPWHPRGLREATANPDVLRHAPGASAALPQPPIAGSGNTTRNNRTVLQQGETPRPQPPSSSLSREQPDWLGTCKTHDPAPCFHLAPAQTKIGRGEMPQMPQTPSSPLCWPPSHLQKVLLYLAFITSSVFQSFFFFPLHTEQLCTCLTAFFMQPRASCYSFTLNTKLQVRIRVKNYLPLNYFNLSLLCV